MLPRISLFVPALLLAILCACQRDGPAVEARAARVRGTHPWDQPDWQSPVATTPMRNSEPSETAVTPPVDRGPVLPSEDTLLEPAILGRYVQVCQVVAEKMNLVPVDQQDLVSLQPNGYLTWTSVSDMKSTLNDGRWKKTQPGAIEISIGGQPAELFGQLYDNDFLYFWNSPQRTGYWFARIPDRAATSILGNRFATSRGDLKITSNVGASWIGEISGDQPMTVSGFYNAGVLSMRWETQQSGGFAAFIASEDWSSLRGAWWIDDWEAVPFGGGWTGDRQ